MIDRLFHLLILFLDVIILKFRQFSCDNITFTNENYDDRKLIFFQPSYNYLIKWELIKLLIPKQH